MKKLLLALITGIAVAQAPQVTLTGTVGPAGPFPFRNSVTIAMTDADHTMVYPEYSAGLVKLTGTLTAQRNLFALTGDFSFCVKNGTNQPVQIIGIGGTGVVVINGTMQCVQGDGTNYQAASPAGSSLALASINPPLFNGNYPGGYGGMWSTENTVVTQTTMPGDTGGPYTGSAAKTVVFNDWFPGYNYGNGSTVNFSLYLPAAMNIFHSSYSTGIKELLQLNATYTGSGDIAEVNINSSAKNAWITPSDEGFNVWHDRTTEAGEYTGTILTASPGSMTLTAIGNIGSLGIDSPLIDLNTAVSGTVTFVSGAGVATVTTSFAVPISTTGTLASNCNSPRIGPNNTLQLSSNVVTCTVNTTATLTVGELVDFAGPDRNEVSKLTAVGVPSGGVQSITATLFFSHTTGTVFYAGGAVGDYLTLTGSVYQPSGNIYVEQIYGSTGANTIIVGHRYANGFASFLQGLTAVPATLYQGADVVGVVNPATGRPDNGGYVATMPAVSTAFLVGHTVENTNNISAQYKSMSTAMAITNPFAGRIQNIIGWPGFGGGLNQPFNGWTEFQNTNASTSYIGGGGSYQAPWLIYAEGPVANGIALSRPPIAGSAQGIGVAAPNCGGFMLCIGGAPYAGQSSVEGIFNQGDQTASLTYDHATNFFKFAGSGVIANNIAPVYSITGTMQGAAHTVIGSVTVAAVSTPITLTGAAAFTSAASYSCTWNPESIVAGSTNIPITYSSGSSFTFVGSYGGTFNGVARYICTGN